MLATIGNTLDDFDMSTTPDKNWNQNLRQINSRQLKEAQRCHLGNI